MASVYGDTRTAKLNVFYITDFSMCVIDFQDNDDFEISNVHNPRALNGTTGIWKVYKNIHRQ